MAKSKGPSSNPIRRQRPAQIFNANGTPGQGSELWRYDGSGMPEEAARIYPNNGSGPEEFAVYDGKLYFRARDADHGNELWCFNGALYFSADDGYVPGLGSLQPAVFALSVAPVNPLRLSIAPASPGVDFMINLANCDGSPVTPEQAAQIRVLKSTGPTLPLDQWQPMPNPPTTVGGGAQILDPDISGLPRCFYRAVRQP